MIRLLFLLLIMIIVDCMGKYLHFYRRHQNTHNKFGRLQLSSKEKKQKSNQNKCWRLFLLQHQSRWWWHVRALRKCAIKHLICKYFRYPANIKCEVTYKLSGSCKKLKFSCNKANVDLPNQDRRRCRRGDKILVGKKV